MPGMGLKVCHCQGVRVTQRHVHMIWTCHYPSHRIPRPTGLYTSGSCDLRLPPSQPPVTIDYEGKIRGDAKTNMLSCSSECQADQSYNHVLSSLCDMDSSAPSWRATREQDCTVCQFEPLPRGLPIGRQTLPPSLGMQVS